MNHVDSRNTVCAVALALALAMAVCAWAAPSQMSERDRNESRAVGTLRSYASAEATFMAKFKRPATLDELVSLEYMEPGCGNGSVRDGYRYTQGVIDTKTMEWEVKAEPVDANHGAKAFNVVEDYIIRYREGATAPDRKDGRVLGAE